MKKLLVPFFAGLALLTAQPVSAQTEPTVTVHTTNTPLVYWKDFDVLVSDFTVHSFAGDSLKALTAAKSGSAWEGYEYVGATLWADRGVEGFQGWGYDEKLADGELKSGLWVFSPVDGKFAADSQRFFISIESAVPFERNLQFSILPTGEDGDLVYEDGEQGIFLSNSVVTASPDQFFSQTIIFKPQKNDFSAPKAYVADLSVDEAAPVFIYKPLTQTVVWFTGEARDRNGDNVLGVSVAVNGQTIQAESVGTGFAEWKAGYIPTLPYEEVTVRVMATDGSREFTSEAYYAIIDSRAVSLEKSSFVSQPDVVQVGGSAHIDVTLKGEDGSLIGSRQVEFVAVRAVDELSSSNAVTDAQGKASVSLSVNAVGTAVVKVLVDGLEVGSVDVTVTEESGEEPPVAEENVLSPGNLVKGSTSAVYFIGTDNKRHVFESARVYASWYGSDFSKVISITDELLASRPLGEAVPFRPGSLVKVPSLPAVYVVDVGNVLRHVTTEALARELFGDSWNRQVHDLQESLLFTYEFSTPIDEASDLDLGRIADPFLSLNAELVS